MAASNLAVRPSKDALQPSSTLQSTGHFGALQTMENFDDLPLNFSLRWPGWRCCDFATVWANLESISCRRMPPSAGRLGASLCALPPSSTPSSTINYKPMLAHSTTTTEQRSDMDAFELGNDSGSLLACRNRLHSPQARGRLRGWTQPLGLDQQGLEAVLDSKEDSHRGRVRRELSRASLTRLLVFLTGSKSSLGFGRLGLETGA